MKMFERGIADVGHPFWLRRKIMEAAAPKRWPGLTLSALGALVLMGYLMVGQPASTVVTTPASAPVDSLGGSSAIIFDSGASSGASTRSSIIDAAVGTLLAAGWLASGLWIGIRSARGPSMNGDDVPSAYAKRSAHDRSVSDRSRICQ